MLCTWLILFHLLKLGYSNDEDIEVCVKEVGEPKKKRPTVDPSHCYDAKPEVCIALFKKQDQTFANNPKPDQDYKVHPGCKADKYASLSVTECASSCAKCCLTKQFSCTNDAASQTICEQLDFVKDCKNPVLYPLFLARCPAACGICDQPGALGECPDRSDICPNIIGLDPNACNMSNVADMCMKSCKLKTCLPGSSICEDKRPNCISYQPFCNSQRYADFLKRECCRTCSAPAPNCFDSRTNCQSYKPFCTNLRYAEVLRRQCCHTCTAL